MIDVRPLKDSEIEAAKQLVPEGCAEPNWKDTLAVIEDGEVVWVMGMQLRLHAEPAYCKKGHYAAALLGFGVIDGYMRRWAQNLGLTGYEFHISNEQPKFQLFAAKHFPVVGMAELPGITFLRVFK